MTVGRPAITGGVPARDQRRLEAQVLVLQSTIAGFFVLGALLGWFGTRSTATAAGAAWIAGYHLVHAAYVVLYRMRRRPIGWVEAVTPPLDVSCITMAWILIDQPTSPFWAVYLYALVGYGRRYHGRRYFLLASYIVVNVIAGRVAIALGAGQQVFVNAELATMVVMTAAMATLAHAVGAAWRGAERRARFLAETDALTGIANRRVFHDRLEALAEDARAGFAVLMLDLDDFKRLNDEYGHLHGDDVLANVAGVLSDGVRADDLVARYGGEEFVVAMPGISLSGAIEVAERLRGAIAEATPTTVSVGCAVREPGERAESVLRRADDLLLAAKRTGKNTVWSTSLRKTA